MKIKVIWELNDIHQDKKACATLCEQLTVTAGVPSVQRFEYENSGSTDRRRQ